MPDTKTRQHILFIRMDEALKRELQRRLVQEQARQPGQRITLSDYVRTLLYRVIDTTEAQDNDR